jgi:tetratricopeptide (TPR) repeat protein
VTNRGASIIVTCPRCRKLRGVRADQAGRQMRCPNSSCGALIDVPPRPARHPLWPWLCLAVVFILGGTLLLELHWPFATDPPSTEEVRAPNPPTPSGQGPAANAEERAGKSAPAPARKGPRPPEPRDALGYNHRGIGLLQKGKLADAGADFSAAIRLDPNLIEAYRNRGYTRERLGQLDAAREDFETPDRLETAARPPPPQTGDRVVAVRPIADAKSRNVLVEAGTGLTVVGVQGDKVAVKAAQGLGLTQWAVSGTALARGGSGSEDRNESVPEKELYALLLDAFAHEYVGVTVNPAGAGPGSLIVMVSAYGPAPAATSQPGRTQWSCVIRTADWWESAASFLAAQADYLEPQGTPLVPDTGGNPRGLRLFYHLPPRRFVRVGSADHLLLSERAQRYLKVEGTSSYAASRHVLLVGEPHWDQQAQFALYRGLELLFEDNPYLLQEKRTAFLAEGTPAGQAVSVQPLVEAAARPDNQLIRRVLDTFLVPGYAAYEWKHQQGIPIVGHEDADLYRVSARLWADGAWANDSRFRLWQQAVAARNPSMVQSLLDVPPTRDCPILFLGGMHLDYQVESLPEGVWQGFRGLLNETDLERLKKAEKRTVAELLEQRGIGYTFLQPAQDLFPDRRLEERARLQYLALFRAQAKNEVQGYLDVFVKPRGDTTVAANTVAAARAVQVLKTAAGEGGGREGSGDDDEEESDSSGRAKEVQRKLDETGNATDLERPARPATPENPPPSLPEDPATPPGPGWRWRGKQPPGGSQGAWENPETGENLHPHPDSPKHGPHWDWIDPGGHGWRIYPNGNVEPK